MESIEDLLYDAHKATTVIRVLPDEQKKALLNRLATIISENKESIILENKKDLDGMADSDPKKDRLLLNYGRIDDLYTSIKNISVLPDPAGKLLFEHVTEAGLFIQKKTVPLGVVGVIYESRPNVTIDVAALCIRSGNVCVLRGGSDAWYTNNYLVKLIHSVLKEFGLNEAIVQLLPVDRKFIMEMLRAVNYIDIIIPRGSQQLIAYVRENSRVPVIETGAGVCHTYVERTAKLTEAAAVVINAKTSRPSVCNSLDTVLVDRAVARALLGLIVPCFMAYEVEIFADIESHVILNALNYPYLREAGSDDFGREFLDFKCSVKVVTNAEEALEHISNYSSKHSEAIISQDPEISERFINEVDAAAVYINASTRFTDGAVFGLGAEIGISTQKLHARGPFGLEKLVTEKWFIWGDGQIR